MTDRLAIILALHRTKGNKSKAAEWLGISRQTLRAKLKMIESGGHGDARCPHVPPYESP